MNNAWRNLLMVMVMVMALTTCGFARAQSAPHGAEFDEILVDLSRNASPEQYDQVAQAIAATPSLDARLSALASAHRLTKINVLPPADPAKTKSLFSGSTNGSTMVLTPELLTALRKQRLFDVAHQDDVLPNQTVFVLAHLTHHLEAADAAQSKAAMANVNAWMAFKIKGEAEAFIDAWNTTVEEGTARNGRPLTVSQAGTMLLNCRYRFALIGARSKGVAPPTIGESGGIATSEANIDSVGNTLKVSTMADIE
jgi:hypothetical protein